MRALADLARVPVSRDSSSLCGAPLASEYTKQPAPEEATWHDHWNLHSGKVYNDKMIFTEICINCIC